MAISTLIVDDEQLARAELMYLLESVADIEIVAQGANGIEAVDLIEEHHPDLVFLDVQMPGLDGFAVIQRVIDRHRKRRTQDQWSLPQFVFATAYDQYAVRAFDVNAVDYLLKPFDPNRLERHWSGFGDASQTAPPARPQGANRRLSRNLTRCCSY